MAKSCKYGLSWDKYFFNFGGVFNILRTIVFDLSTFALFLIGIEFASAATDLGQAGNKAVKEGYDPGDQPKGDVESGWAAFISLTPFIIIVVWGIAHIIYKYFVKCPAANEEIRKLSELEKKFEKELQEKAIVIEDDKRKKLKIKEAERKEERELKGQAVLALANQGINAYTPQHMTHHHNQRQQKSKSHFHIPFIGHKSKPSHYNKSSNNKSSNNNSQNSNYISNQLKEKLSKEAMKHADTLISQGSDSLGSAISKSLSSAI